MHVAWGAIHPGSTLTSELCCPALLGIPLWLACCLCDCCSATLAIFWDVPGQGDLKFVNLCSCPQA
jgi:hypothetical protein